MVVSAAAAAAASASLQRREGEWYPAGLPGSDMQGMVGYKIWLSVGLLLGEGAYIMAKAALLGELDRCIGCCCAAGVVFWLGEEPPSWFRQHCLVRADQLTILVDNVSAENRVQDRSVGCGLAVSGAAAGGGSLRHGQGRTAG
jgi:hypothetical protein